MGNESSKKLVVYYSLEGNTKLVAEAIAKEAGADILELKPKKDIPSKGFRKFLWGGKQVVFKEKPELEPLNKKPEQYDVIVIGTPVWAGSFAPPIRTFLSFCNLKGKKIAMFCCYAGARGRTFDELKSALSGCEFIGEVDFNDPLKRQSEASIIQAKQWAKSLN